MSRRRNRENALARVETHDGWTVWVDRAAHATGIADDSLGRPGLWREQPWTEGWLMTFACPPLPASAFGDEARGTAREAALRDWVIATALRERPEAWSPPERVEAAGWLDFDRLNVRVGSHVAKGSFDCEADRLRLCFPDLVRLAPELPDPRREWIRALCLDAQSRWQGIRIGVAGGRVGAEVDLTGVPLAWAEPLLSWAIEALVHSVGWILPSLALVADPAVSSSILETPPPGGRPGIGEPPQPQP